MHTVADPSRALYSGLQPFRKAASPLLHRVHFSVAPSTLNMAMVCCPPAHVAKRPRISPIELTVGSVCSGMGMCHRAAAKLTAANPHIVLKTAFFCENARGARKALEADFPNTRLFGDIAEVVDRLPSCDILMAGFPCQPFSHANRRRRGSRDPRADVIKYIRQYIERTLPRVIILENVLGILSWGRDVLRMLQKFLTENGYELGLRTLGSHVHGGVPQSRLRVYIVAIRSPTADLEWPEPIPMQPLPAILSDDRMDKSSRPSAKRAAEKLQKARNWLTEQKVTEEEMVYMVCNCHSQMGQVFVSKTPCLTSTRGAQGGFWLMQHNRMMHTHELLRLQGLDPADTQMSGVLSKQQIGHLLGNAFTLPVACRVLVSALRSIGCRVKDPFL